MEEVIKDGDLITIKTENIEVIDLGIVKKELEELLSEEQPSDEELLVHARAGVTHPYYSMERLSRISELENLIEKYK